MSFIKVLTMVVCVLIGGASITCKRHVILPASRAQMEELAAAVYTYFDGEDMRISAEQCMNNFIDSFGDTNIDPSQILEVNTSMRTVTFRTTPSKHTQLVVLMPKENKNELLENLIVDPEESIGYIETDIGHYTIWVRGFDAQCHTSAWLKGPEFSLDKEKHEYREYHVQAEFQQQLSAENKPVISGIFRWNSTDDTDNTFDIVNSCQGKIAGDILMRTIRGNRSISIDNLLVDDKCLLTITGKFGVTEFRYHTPICKDIPECFPDPEVPQITTIEAKETRNGNWDVHIEWLKPKHNPNEYNITLFTSQEINMTVPGNKTAATFLNVSGIGVYEVLIIAVSDKGIAFNTTKAMFPPVSLQQNSVGMVVAGIWCGIIISAITLSGLMYWKKQYLKKKLYQLNDDFKIGKYLTSMSSHTEPIIQDSWEILPERLLLHEVIGEGAFGLVRRGMLSGKEVAVKMLKDFPTREEIRSFRAEMELMKSVGEHPHVVSLLGCCTQGKLFIVSEYCGRGDLLSYLRCFWDTMVSKRNFKYYNNNDISDDFAKTTLLSNEEDGKLVVNKLYDLQGVCDVELTPLDLLSFCRQIAKGMEFLAANRVVHRDLAARNVLVSGDRTLKIADFGLSRDVYQNDQYKQEGPGKIPVKWMALESLTKRIYTTKSDVWSFGVLVWEVVTVGGSPYADIATNTLPKILRAGYRLPRPNNCSPFLYELMLSCWRQRPRERPSFSELHARLDELLQDACAGRYISLDIVDDAAPPPLPAPSYLHMLFAKTPLAWSRGQVYQKSHQGSNYNHYTSTPVTLTPPQFA